MTNIFYRATSPLASAILLIFLGKQLSVVEFGSYSIYISISALISMFAAGIYRKSLVRFGSSDKRNLFGLLLSVIIISVVILCCSLIFHLFGSAFVALVMLFAAGTLIYDSVLDTLIVLDNFIVFAILSILRPTLIIFIMTYYTITDIEGAIAIIAITYLVLGCLAAILLMTRYMREKAIFRFFQYAQYALPLLAGSIFTYIIDNSGRFLILHFSDPQALGIFAFTYSAGQQAVGSIMTVIYSTYFPKLVRSYDAKDSDTFSNLKYFLLKCYIIVLLGIFITYLIIDKILLLLNLTDYQGNSLLFLIIMVAIWLGTVKTYYVDLVFLLRKETGVLFNILVFGALVTVTIGYFLVPNFAAYGAGLASFFGFLLMLFMSMRISALRFREID